MKMLLFVQTGDARPTVRWTGASARRVAACFARDEARNAAHPDHADKVPPYWLVECANADAGRARIAHADTPYCTPDTCACGGARILASGGKP